jgi:hypothetical protein
METYGNFSEEITKILTDECVKDGFEPTEANILDTLTEAKEVYREIVGEHRWYEDLLKVVEIDGRFIGFIWGNVTGDNCLSDIGWVFKKQSAKFYVPIQVTVTKYVEATDGK